MEPLHSADPARIAGYRVLGRLGAGGMGVVLLGRSQRGVLVAIKLIRAEYADDAGFRTRFRREVSIARQVRNRWAVPVVDADTEAAAPWLATEFVPGPALSDAIGPGAPFPEHSVRALGGMLAEALEAVHAAGMVHRDVKPGNILLGLDGPRLIDFGIARALDDTVLTATGTVVGSPGFLSPEQAQGRRIGPPSDIFSLGCVLAYAATGRRPFGSGPVDAMLFRTVYDPPDLDGVPPALLPVVQACLSKEAESRPTAARIRTEWAQDAAGQSWLPAPVTHLIASRSAEMLSLPDIESTQFVTGQGGADADTRPAVPPSSPAPGRRRFLTYLAAGGAVLAAGGATTAWLANAGDGGGTGTGGDGKAEPRPVLGIGVQADLSGELSAQGKAQNQGAQLAVDAHNAREDAPFTLKLTTLDDGGDETKALAAARRFTEDASVVAVLGATSTAAAGAVLSAYDEAALSVISVTDGDTRHINRVFLCARPNNAMQMVPVSAYLGVHDLDDIALVDNETEYSRQVTRFLGEGLRTGGDRNVLAETLPLGGDNYASFARQLAVKRPGAVVHGGDWQDVARFARALAETDYRGPKIATQAAYDPRFLREAGDAGDDWLIVSTAVDPSSVRSAGAFGKEFRARFDAAPPPFAAEAYDAVRLVAACVEGLGRENVSREDLVPVLRTTTFKGVSKPYAFDKENGWYTGDQGVFFYRAEGGRFRFLDTDPAKV
ncbi:bifunctional serine/threonine-protein kinase/ABC transporter substrate-binding protein [Streptomyces sp. NP-1717]|uniref:bifunctional serine/threonine-protein kinase/ABC transporter substrate-binding protein n=1 Tax=Streptomyces sp. NP-1717 TaxID=2704470 RepID=UPI001F5D26BB|nr:bifunctional serine/threonine-protein kinase/ABC transporter substrate-binding protein [Streptomyces sp. NP-1717]MCI3222354.1 ABC transporter substrate-binding protein [Streptomyces sp. NP-1717]